jgi:organic radical activating enzyme
MRIAVLLFAYQRPHYLVRALKSHTKDLSLDYFAFVDKSDMQDLIINMINTKGFYRIVKRGQHLGIERNIIDGVNEVFDKGYDAVIVLEDDLVLKSDALSFLKTELTANKNNDRIGAITCNKGTFNSTNWGWAWGIWRDRWEKIIFDDRTWDRCVVEHFIENDLIALFSSHKRVKHIGNNGSHFNFLSKFRIRERIPLVTNILTRIVFTIQKSKKGILAGWHPTTRCNLNCSYCTSAIWLGEEPKFKELTGDEWIKIFTPYIGKIKVMTISGGEPAIYKDIVKVVEWLVSKKIAVRILTNLTSLRLLEIKRTPYVRIFTTYHHGQIKLEKYQSNLEKYKRYFLTAVNEIEGKGKFVAGSKEKSYQTFDDEKQVSDTPEGKDLNSCRLVKSTLFIPNGRIVDSQHAQDLLALNYK